MIQTTTHEIAIEFSKLIASQTAVAVHGGRTKCGLLDARSDAQQIDMRRLDGIVTYDPSEFLVTARAGTLISTLVAALAEHGQYLPFDPVLVASGATLGGTIVSGISGPDRMLYGSLRDFVMEVELIDGLGRLVRGGGKVVKNSAGFDLPKLMVGSYGRLGALTEATLKVFPKPPAFVTQRFEFGSMAAALAAMQKLQTNPLPISAIEIEPLETGTASAGAGVTGVGLVVRFAGRPEALAVVARRAERLVQMDAPEISDAGVEAKYWSDLSEFAFVSAGNVPAENALVRIAMSGRKLLAVELALRTLDCVAGVRFSCGASVGWVTVRCESAGALAELDKCLSALAVAGVVVRGAGAGLKLLGDRAWVAFSEKVRVAMDPQAKFGGFASEFATEC